MEAPTPTPNREPMVAHFTFELPTVSQGYSRGSAHGARGNFANPEYFETDSNESESSFHKEDQNHRRKGLNMNKKKDYYNDVNELCSDGGSTRGSTAESTSSI